MACHIKIWAGPVSCYTEIMRSCHLHSPFSSFTRYCCFVRTIFLTAALIIGTAHSDFDHPSEIDNNATDVLVYGVTETAGNQFALQASHPVSCPSQSVCHSQQLLMSKMEAARRPLPGNFCRLLPDFSFGKSRMVSPDDPPPIA